MLHAACTRALVTFDRQPLNGTSTTATPWNSTSSMKRCLSHSKHCIALLSVLDRSAWCSDTSDPLRSNFLLKFQDENFADPIEIKPLGNSWARTLVGPKDTSQYFNDYFGGSSDTSTYEEVEEFTQRPRRPPSPQEYYQQQKYHFTPTETPMHDADEEGKFWTSYSLIHITNNSFKFSSFFSIHLIRRIGMWTSYPSSRWWDG